MRVENLDPASPDEAMLAGSDAMLIHLGRSVLGQTYKVDVAATGKPTVVYVEHADNPRDAELDHWTEQRNGVVICLPRKQTVEELEAIAAARTVLHLEENGFDRGEGDHAN